ncbi:MAG TPA: capsule assembly Wzi family protein [Terriglobales bacterium]|nr:capsule assembly Wzi family protein [Terriglobales bacterium]
MRVQVALIGTAMAVCITTISWCQNSVSQPVRFALPTGTQRYGEMANPGSAPIYATNYDILPTPERSSSVSRLLMDFAQDQKQIWTSPARIRFSDLTWLVPLGGLTAGLLVTDREYSASLSQNPSTIKNYKNLSNVGLAALVGAGAGMYLGSFPMHNDHWRETGFLSGEAVLNSLVATEVLKYSFGRQRPYQGSGAGSFFSGGTSFPSEHAAASWAVAGVIAHEYPGILPQLLAYGAASVVSYSRIHARQHFPSDVLVGSVMGYFIAQGIYNRRHDPELGGRHWAGPWEPKEDNGRSLANMGSPHVPLDSWVYPALQRLEALGYVNTAYVGLRPWTRLECARLVEEAGENMRVEGLEDRVAEGIYQALSAEFLPEAERRGGVANLGVSLDSIYTRMTGISGPPLTDGYHFGQTIINDYGRPYGEGFNNVTGMSAHAEAGPWSFYVRSEYQHASAIPAYPFATQQEIANADATTPVSNATGTVDRLHIIDASVALTVNNVQLSFGKQSLWLGPGRSMSLLLSNNADSIMMMNIESVSPFKIPLLSQLLGPLRAQYFLGQLGGTQFELNGSTLLGPGSINPQPVLSGVKANFKPTPNFEFGMGITAQFRGPGLPFTWSNFLRTFYIHNQTGPTSNNANPGKRISSADFTYRVPRIRNWLSIYADTLVVDELSPIGSTRATVNPGFYMPQLPKLPRMELRAEGFNEPLTSEFAPGFVYYGARRYHSGYTNEGNLMGSWIGRAAHGGQGWLTYSFSPRTKLEAGYRHQEVSKAFIGGGRAVDYSLQGEALVNRALSVAGWFQYEQWNFPMLAATGKSNITASLQVTFYPHWRTH